MSNEFIHLDLFSGIGGFAYAVDEVWPGAEHIFCDNNWFCQAALEKTWKGARIYNDISTLSRERLIADANGDRQPGGAEIDPGETGEQTQRDAEAGRRPASNAHDRRPPVGKEQTAGDNQCSGRVDLLTGGFPCQPFSQAGKRKGKDDDRFLWPEMLRIIQEFRPTWIIGENVDGLTTMVKFESELEMDNRRYTEKEMADGSLGVGEVRGRWGGGILDEIVADIKSLGYEVQPFIIPACAVGAPHRRDRIWIVASDTQGVGQRGRTGQKCRDQFSRRVQPEKQTGSVARRKGQGRASNATNPEDKGLEGRDGGERKTVAGPRQSSSWSEPWIEVAPRLCTLDDGLSRKLVRLPDGRKISHSKWWQEALKAAGNAIVPQVAIELMRAIKEVDNGLD